MPLTPVIYAIICNCCSHTAISCTTAAGWRACRPPLPWTLNPEPLLPRGSYMWRGGRLARVPAARADIFRDRGLGPADKRALMRFLTAAADALRGTGPLHVGHTSSPALTSAQNGGCCCAVRWCAQSAPQEPSFPQALPVICCRAQRVAGLQSLCGTQTILSALSLKEPLAAALSSLAV